MAEVPLFKARTRFGEAHSRCDPASTTPVPPFALSVARSRWQGDYDNAKSGT